jgi:hypothetical protein
MNLRLNADVPVESVRIGLMPNGGCLAHGSVSAHPALCDLHPDMLKSAPTMTTAKNLTSGAGN